MAQIASLKHAGGTTFSTALQIVVTCSDRKKLPVPAALRLSSFPHQMMTRARARAWTARLKSHEAPTLPARLLYAGDHWHVAQSLAGFAPGRMELWVASAGYGLIRDGQAIKPYSATFSPGPDSVASASQVHAQRRKLDDVLREWWAALVASELVGGGAPRSLKDLAAQNPEAILIVALSRDYLRALRDDLVAARAELRGPGKLLVISAGTKACPGLEENLLSVGAEVQDALGGSRLSLNVRIVRHLLQTYGQHEWVSNLAAAELKALSNDQGQPAQRTPLSDSEVIDFIVRARGESAGVSRSALLRQLRDQGFACEQGRFRDLFERTGLK